MQLLSGLLRIPISVISIKHVYNYYVHYAPKTRHTYMYSSITFMLAILLVIYISLHLLILCNSVVRLEDVVLVIVSYLLLIHK